MLQSLPDGLATLVATWLDTESLKTLDVTSKTIRELNRGPRGPWCAVGADEFSGFELEGEGRFDHPPIRLSALLASRPPHACYVDWKQRYMHFKSLLPNFKTPFGGRQILGVGESDAIAYLRCRLCTEKLSLGSQLTAYLEVQVDENPDNVSFCIVDFDSGGCSSLTFSPDTGAVIRERKVRDSPPGVEGAYIQPLGITTPGQGFEGNVGLFVREGELAFFRKRRFRASEERGGVEEGPWETTGFVTDWSWADGAQVTPCLAFRNKGHYKVRVVRFGGSPPIVPSRNPFAYDERNWSRLDWDSAEEEHLTSE